MRPYVSSVLLAVTFLALTVPIQAHHSITALWFTDRTVPITGVVTSFKLVNPHPELAVEVTEPNGETSLWYVTATSNLRTLLQRGWRPDTLPIGTRVTVEGSPPRREGLRALAAGKVTTEDGSVMWLSLEMELPGQ